ncbi:MAG: hypothetical protein EBT26_07700 [Microbacteriaceae bacterium]|nr:hypothetical protein [Microbacteriaceae bacterium]NBS61901.1 hypothetical protein [Microbacteriaceae bacterium]
MIDSGVVKNCSNCAETGCQCARSNAVNIFSREYKAGELKGRRDEATRTTDALIELERKGVITNAQMQTIFDLILEKLTDVKDIP